jgi:hypothetical protein
MSWLEQGNPTGVVRIGKAYYLLRNGSLYQLEKRGAIGRLLIVAGLIVIIAALILMAWRGMIGG